MKGFFSTLLDLIPMTTWRIEQGTRGPMKISVPGWLFYFAVEGKAAQVVHAALIWVGVSVLLYSKNPYFHVCSEPAGRVNLPAP